MNILFVYTVSYALSPPAKPLVDWTEISFGISYIASVLEQAGHKIQLVVLRREQFKNDIDRVIQDFQPRLLCFTPVATEYPFVKKIAQYFRETIPQSYQIIGGAHASLQPLDVLKGPFNAVCISEGEYAVVELAEFLEKEKRPTLIPNLWIKQGDSIEKNATKPFIQQLDEIPFAHREMWRPWVDCNTKHSLLVGRGCPFTCAYCCNHALKKLTKE
ncbi:MAG: cobalamin-dependent protein [Thiomargarita sp.]|nr:cobalamin-dependent protein [Thiomargarita sp.]